MNNRKRMIIRAIGQCLNYHYRFEKWIARDMHKKQTPRELVEMYHTWIRELLE